MFAMFCELINLSQLDKQWNTLSLTLQNYSDYYESNVFEITSPPSIKEFLGPHDEFEISANDHLPGQKKAGLLRLSVIKSAIKCFRSVSPNSPCRNQNVHVSLMEDGKKSNFKIQLLEFLTEKNIVEFIMNSLVSKNRFTTHVASDGFLKYFLIFPETLLKHGRLLDERISKMCTDNRLMFIDLFYLMTKSVANDLKREDDQNVWPVVKIHQNSFDILSKFWKYFDLKLGSSEAQNHSELYLKRLCKLELHSKWKCFYQILKLHNLINSLLKVRCDSLDSYTAANEPMEQDMSENFHSFMLETKAASVHFTSIENLFPLNSLLNYSCGYALKIIKFRLETTEDRKRNLIYACEILNFFMRVYIEPSVRCQDANTEFSIRVAAKDDDFITSVMPQLRLWIIILLRSCWVIADNVTGDEYSRIIDLLARLSSYLSASYFDTKKDVIPILRTASSWLEVLMDEDDQLCEAMLYLFRIYHALPQRNQADLNPDYKEKLQEIICPHFLFYCLMDEISFDHLVCIDWLISNETCFDKVLILYLDIAISDFESFIDAMRDIDTHDVISDVTSSTNCNFANASSGAQATNAVANQDHQSNELYSSQAHANIEFCHAGRSVDREAELAASGCSPEHTKTASASSINESNKTDEASEIFFDSSANSPPNQFLTAERIMDFLIRLRLKLERFLDKRLTQKQLKPIIGKLNNLDDLFDSYSS